MRLAHLWNMLSPPTAGTVPLPENRWHGWLFWLLWSALISAIYWILGPDSYMRVQDNLDFNVPYRIAAARDLLEYGWTFWQPRFSGGMPSMVHPQVDSFLVDGLPYLFFPAWAVYGFMMWLQRFLAGYFTFRLCRDVLKFDAIAATFAGMAFSLYFWNVQDLKLVEALGLPAVALTFLLFERILGQPAKRGMLLALLLGLTTALVAQSVIYTFFIMLGLPFWFWIARGVPFKQGWGCFAAFAIGIALGESTQLLALLTYSPFTTRGQIGQIAQSVPRPSLTDMARHAWEIMGWELLPQNGLYLGLFLLGMLVARQEKRQAWRLLGIYLVAGLGSEVGYWLQCNLPQWIPPSRGNLLDFNQFTIFLGPLLGGAGLDLARRQAPDSRPMRLMITLVTLLALLLPVANWKEVTRQLMHRLSTDNYTVHFTNPVLLKLATERRPDTPPFRVASVGTWPPSITAASGGRIYPAVMHAYGLETVDGYYRLHSARYHQLWERVVAKTMVAHPEQTGRTIKWYYLFMRPEERFARRAPLEMSDWFNMDLLSLANARFLVSQWPLRHPDLALWHDPAQELAQGQEWEALRLREKIWRTLRGNPPHHALYVYENRAALPRLFFPETVRLFQQPEALLDALASGNATELSRTAYLESRDFPDWQQTPPVLEPGTARFTRYTPDHLEVSANTPGPALLLVTNSYDPYWRVTINGVAGTILPADHAFWGIRLPAGNHRLVFDYHPPYRPGR
ncbi:MAG: YfhO family protein [Magnetococcales bacterium]|nr:YfhO family protein [Magnetococcales bacterium]